MATAGKPQRAQPRSTEGSHPTTPGSHRQRGVTRPDVVESVAPGEPHKRGRGRPKGSTNKAKSILPTELANTMLLAMKDALPPEHFEYIKGVIKDGKAISTERELDTLILLLSRNLYPALVYESFATGEEEDSDDFFDDDEKPSKPKAEPKMKMPVFRKDVTERLKVLQSLLAQKEKSERAKSDSESEKPILSIVGRSGIDAGRIRVLVGIDTGGVSGSADEDAQPALPPRTVSGEVLERPEPLSPSEQGTADWVLDSNQRRGVPPGSDS